MLKGEVDVAVARDVLKHTDVRTTMGYVHVGVA